MFRSPRSLDAFSFMTVGMEKTKDFCVPSWKVNVQKLADYLKSVGMTSSQVDGMKVLCRMLASSAYLMMFRNASRKLSAGDFPLTNFRKTSRNICGTH